MRKLFTIILAIISISVMTSAYAAETSMTFNDKTDDPTVEITIGTVTSTSVEATFTPNESCASYYILLSPPSEMEQWSTMMGVTIDQLVMMWGLPLTSEHTYNWTDNMAPNTEYFVYALPMDADGNTYSVVSESVTTTSLGGEGTSVIALEVEVLSETSVKTIATPNDETSVYHYGLMEREYFDSIGEAAAIELIRNDGYPLYVVDEWIWLDIVANTDYYAIASGQNSNGEWGETTIVEFTTSLSSEPTVEITIGKVTALSVEVTFTPTENCASYNILIGPRTEMEQLPGSMGVTIEELVMMWGLPMASEQTHNWDNNIIPDTEYTVFAVPVDADGNTYTAVSEDVTTPSLGGTGVSVIALEVEVLSETSVKTIAIPNEETTEYHYGIMEGEYFNSIGEHAAVEFIRNDGCPLYGVDEWIWQDAVMPNTKYYVIASGQNVNGEWGETTIVTFTTSLESTSEIKQNDLMIFPNPVSTTLNIKTKSVGEAEVKIFDMAGRCVLNTVVSDIKDADIDVSNLVKGVYIINVKGMVEKLVVE